MLTKKIAIRILLMCFNILVILSFLLIVSCTNNNKLNNDKPNKTEQNNMLPKQGEAYLGSPIKKVEIFRSDYRRSKGEVIILNGELLDEFIEKYRSLGLSRLTEYGVNAPAPDYNILITFENGVRKSYSILGRGALAEWKDNNNFYHYIWEFSPIGAKIDDELAKFESSLPEESEEDDE